MKKPIYYYIRGTKNYKRKDGSIVEHNPPAITVCLLESEKFGGIWARGISICSAKDNINKEKGKEEALKKAKKALKVASGMIYKNQNSGIDNDAKGLFMGDGINEDFESIQSSMVKYGWEINQLPSLNKSTCVKDWLYFTPLEINLINKVSKK